MQDVENIYEVLAKNIIQDMFPLNQQKVNWESIITKIWMVPSIVYKEQI